MPLYPGLLPHRSHPVSDLPRTILSIDPGPVRSAWMVFNDTVPEVFGMDSNEGLLHRLRTWHDDARLTLVPFLDAVVIEKVEAMGMAVGAEVFETVWWSGQFAEAARWFRVDRVTRRQVKLHLCGNMRAKDPNIRQALIDRFGGPDAIGKKASPGPLYGIAADVWSALAVAVTYADAG